MQQSEQKFKCTEENNEYVDVDCDEFISNLYFFDSQLLDDTVEEIEWKIVKFENDEKHTDNNNKEFELIISIKQQQNIV